MSARVARALAAGALALLLAAPAPGSPARGAAGRLKALTDAFAARRLARAPLAARRSGPHADDPLAHTVSAPALADERAWLSAFSARLDSLRAAPLPPGPSAERAVLLAAVERDSLELLVLRPFERDPGAYLALVSGAVGAALDRASSPCAGLRLAARRLGEVPEVLRAARVNLREPPRTLTELAIERCHAALRLFREAVPRAVADCRSPRMQADLAVADTIAVRALESFLGFLEQDLLPASRGRLAIGPEACRRLVAATLMTEVAPAESLLAESARLVDARRAELDSLAAIVSPAGVRAALDSLAVGPGEDDAIAAGERAVERVTGFLRGTDLVSLPPRLDLRVRQATSIQAVDGLRLAGPEARAPAAGPAWLEIAAAGEPRRGRWETDLAVAGEGMPGRLLRALAAGESAPRLGPAVADIWPGGDWGQYCERMLVDVGYGGQDPRYRLALAARSLRQSGRSLAALGLAAGTLSPDDARRMLEDRCLLAPREAERETRWAASDATLMGYTIGAQRLLELQEEAWRRLGPRFRARTFHDAVLHCGVAPYGYVRDRLWRELDAGARGDPVGAKP